MKTHISKKYAFLALFSLCCLGTTYASDDHDHSQEAHKEITSPNGGRIITSVEPHFEFLLQADRTAKITFIDDAGKPIPAAKQQISLTGGDRSAPVNIDFVQKEGALLSVAPMPDIQKMPVVLQIKVTPDAKKVREKFYLNTSNCGSCSYLEYACICGH